MYALTLIQILGCSFCKISQEGATSSAYKKYCPEASEKKEKCVSLILNTEIMFVAKGCRHPVVNSQYYTPL